MTEKKSLDRDVKRFLGVPYRWNAKAMFGNVWNKNDARLFPPKQFGWGWDMNFHALSQRVAEPLMRLRDARKR